MCPLYKNCCLTILNSSKSLQRLELYNFGTPNCHNFGVKIGRPISAFFYIYRKSFQANVQELKLTYLA
jgi:hypothetical protein